MKKTIYHYIKLQAYRTESVKYYDFIINSINKTAKMHS